MERMARDLRTLINSRMPFDYINIITMTLHIAQGMEDLHRCGLIHADLKASNILVTSVIMDFREEEVDGWQETSESLYFYVKIGDFESTNGVAGTLFWRAPEVLQALRNDVKPILSPAADGMDTYDIKAVEGDGTIWYYPGEITFSKVWSAFDDAWYLVQETWINHVGRGAGKYPPKTVRKICARYAANENGQGDMLQ
ncbi:unnamed protein product [Sphagnum troendelagicum]|uniref:Protein kinase domain-containing protein n=1 Tax=Sphagnum troendelagicum TaxID=128251 RepID=A0ABP0TSA4_9BRYO